MTDPYDQDRDVVERSYDLDRRILAIPEDKVFTKRAVTAWGGVLVACSVIIMVLVLRVTSSTNEAVRHEVPGLKAQIADRDETIADLEDVNQQAVDWIVLLAQQIVDLGGTPPQIELRPTEDEP